MALLPDITNLRIVDDDDESDEDNGGGGIRQLRPRYGNGRRDEGRRDDQRRYERRGQRNQEELARRAAQAAERQEKKDALKLIGAWIEAVKVTGGRVGPGCDAIHLSLPVLKQLKWVSWNFKRELPNTRIQKIEYVLNETLYDTFNKAKEEFRRHGKNTQEMLLFHGTKPENVNRHCQKRIEIS